MVFENLNLFLKISSEYNILAKVTGLGINLNITWAGQTGVCHGFGAEETLGLVTYVGFIQTVFVTQYFPTTGFRQVPSQVAICFGREGGGGIRVCQNRDMPGFE